MNNASNSVLRSRLNEIEAEISALNAEREEIRTALKVFERYANSIAAEPGPKERARMRSTSSQNNALKGEPRPEGIPTIWEMTRLVFLESNKPLLHIDEIVDMISKRWWPGVIKAQIAPTIYGFAKESDGRLVKGGTGEFSLANKENEPPKGGSETGEGDASPSPSKQDSSGDLLSHNT